MSFIQHYKNAKTCIAQMKRCEWIPLWNSLSNSYITAERNGLSLWLDNGPFFTDIDERNYFGYLFRHWVYWNGVWKLKNSPHPSKNTPVLED